VLDAVSAGTTAERLAAAGWSTRYANGDYEACMADWDLVLFEHEGDMLFAGAVVPTLVHELWQHLAAAGVASELELYDGHGLIALLPDPRPWARAPDDEPLLYPRQAALPDHLGQSCWPAAG
jgi:hypothetical protein